MNSAQSFCAGTARHRSVRVHSRAVSTRGLAGFWLALCALVAVVCGAAPQAWAFPATVQQAGTPVLYGAPGSSFTSVGLVMNNPSGLFISAAGTYYATDTGNGSVVEYTPGGTASYLISPGAQVDGFALGLGSSIAVDGQGNVFVADVVHDRILCVHNGTAFTTISASLSFSGSPLALVPGLSGIAVDTSGHLYIGDTGNKRLLDVAYSTATGVATPSSVVLATPVGVFPGAVTINPSGNVYYAAINYGAINSGAWGVYEEAANGTSYTTIVQTSVPCSEFFGLAVDAAGDVYTSDLYLYGVEEFPVGGNYLGLSSVASYLIQPISSLLQNNYGPAGIALDPQGSVVVANQVASSTDTVDPYFIAQRPIGPIDFGSVAIGSTSQQTVSFNVTGSMSFGTINILTQGAAGLDFQATSPDSSTTLCHTVAAQSGTCTVDVTFHPAAPGFRTGAVVLADTGGNVLATVLLHGVGTGPQVGFGPGVQSVPTLTTALQHPDNLVVDAKGKIYIADPDLPSVLVETPSGAGSYTETTLGSGLQAAGVAVDGAGNVYISSDLGYVYKETLSGGTYEQSTIASGVASPSGVAVDASGNVYIADTFNNQLLKEAFVNGSYTQSILATGLGNPEAVAVDAHGNVYVTDTTNNQVLMETPSGNSYTSSVVASGLNYPLGVSVDALGNVYIANSGNNQIIKEVPSSSSPGTFTPVVVPVGGLSFPFASAVDGNGNVFILDTYNVRMVKLDVSDAPTLSYGSADDGATSAAQSVTVENTGNAALTAVSPGLSVASGFSQVPGGGTPADCTVSFSLAAGASCNLSLEFAPVSPDNGSVSGSVVLTDNSLNSSPSATQTIGLSGTAVLPGDITTTLVAASPSPIGIDQTTNITVTVKDTSNGASIPTGSVTLVDRVGATTVSLNGGAPISLVNGVATLSNVQLSVAGYHYITATYAAVPGSFLASSGGTLVSVVTAASFTIAVPPTAVAGSPFPLTITAHNPDGTLASNYSGTVTFTSTDAGATLPAPSMLTNGVGTFNVTLATAGAQTITASDPNAGISNPGVQMPGPRPLNLPPARLTDTSTAINVLANSQFSSVNVGASATLPFYFHLPASTALGAISVVTNGATGLDFQAQSNDSNPNLCAPGTVTSDTVCRVDVTFTPAAPGTRMGAVVLTDPSGAILQTVYVGGTGAGPLAIFSNASPVPVIFTGTKIPAYVVDLAFDAAGNKYVADPLGSVYKITPQGASTTFASGFAQVASVAVDGAGNVYVCDSSRKVVDEFSAAGTLLHTVGTVGTGLNFPSAVRVDASGNVYIANAYAGTVVKVAPSGVQTTVASGFHAIFAIALDPAGDLYVSDRDGGTATFVPATGGSNKLLASGLSTPRGIALDAAGNLYIAEQGKDQLDEIPAGGTTPVSILTGLGAMYVIVDSSGNLLFSSEYVMLVPRATPPSLTFPSINDGSSSTAQSVVVGNAGNATLTGAGVVTGANLPGDYTQVAGSGTPADCGASLSLAPAATCNYSIQFNPTLYENGTLTGQLLLTDNQLNQSGATQTVTLTGTAVSPVMPTRTTLAQTLPASGNATYGQSVTVTAIVAPTSGTNSPTGTVQFSVDGAAAGAPITLSGGMASFAFSTLTAGGHTIGAVYIPADSMFSASTATALPLNVVQGALTVMATSASRSYGAANPAFTGTYTGEVNGDTFIVTGSTTATAASPVGTYNIVPAATGSHLSDYAVTYVNGTLTVTKATPAVGLTTSAPTVLLQNAVTLTAMVSSSVGTPTGTVTFFDGSSATPLGAGSLMNGVATLTVSSLTVGSHSITAVYSGDANFIGGTSAALSESVVDFNFSAFGTTSVLIAPGGAGVYNLTLTPTSGTFLAPVTLSLSGLPAGSTYTFTPSTIPAGAGTTNVVLSIHTPKPVAAVTRPATPGRGLPRSPIAFGLLLLPIFGAGLYRKKGSALPRYVAIILLLAGSTGAIVGLTGCGGGGFFNQSPQTYAVTITATSGTLQHSTNVSLTVE